MIVMVEKITTGIKGLDVITGGIPRGSSVLVAGGTGCGKSILATQFVYEGAKQFKEPGLMVALETHTQDIMLNMESFNWDIKPLQKLWEVKFII